MRALPSSINIKIICDSRDFTHLVTQLQPKIVHICVNFTRSDTTHTYSSNFIVHKTHRHKRMQSIAHGDWGILKFKNVYLQHENRSFQR